MARAEGDSYVVVIDSKADALSETEGERIFDDSGKPTPMIEERRQFLGSSRTRPSAPACSAAR